MSRLAWLHPGPLPGAGLSRAGTSGKRVLCRDIQLVDNIKDDRWKKGSYNRYVETLPGWRRLVPIRQNGLLPTVQHYTVIKVLSQIPNLLTLVRIVACPILILLLKEGNYSLALALFIFAGITDGLDGYIAKRYNCVSSLGEVLDPLADKLLIASTYIMLAILGDIPFWLLIVVMFRDLVIVAGYLILVAMGTRDFMNPTYISKVNTFTQISLMVCILIEKASIVSIPWMIDLLIIAVLFTTIISGVQYIWQWGIRQEMDGSSG